MANSQDEQGSAQAPAQAPDQTPAQGAGAVPGAVLRRKLGAGRGGPADGGPGADRSWRLALARAARDTMNLALEVPGLSLQRMGLSETLEQVPERSLIVVLQGPAGMLGVLVFSPEVLASIVEMQTIGRVNPGAPVARKPTRTDATISAGLIDAALTGLEVALDDEADLDWAGGYRYGSHIEDARPLGLLLEDREYRVLLAQVSLALGQRSGLVILALPSEGFRPKRSPDDLAAAEAVTHHAFAHALAERVEGASCAMQATLARLSLTLGEVTALAEGAVLPLRQASIEHVQLEGLDGRILGTGRLGQNRGMRALRLVERRAQAAARPLGGAVVQAVAPPAAPPASTALAEVLKPAV